MNTTMFAKDKILALIDAGLSEKTIADGTGVSQPNINRIKKGQEPRESFVLAIDSFYASQMRKRKKHAKG